MQASQPFPTGPAGGTTGQQISYAGYQRRSDRRPRRAEITGRFSRDGSSGFPAEPGRYQLSRRWPAPWSQRALIVRRLLGLERVIGLSLTEPVATSAAGGSRTRPVAAIR